MRCIYAVPVLLFYTLLMFNVTHGDFTDFSDEFHNSKRQILEFLNQLFNRFDFTEADYLKAWTNFQVCEHKHDYLNRIVQTFHLRI